MRVELSVVKDTEGYFDVRAYLPDSGEVMELKRTHLDSAMRVLGNEIEKSYYKG